MPIFVEVIWLFAKLYSKPYCAFSKIIRCKANGKMCKPKLFFVVARSTNILMLNTTISHIPSIK